MFCLSLVNLNKPGANSWPKAMDIYRPNRMKQQTLSTLFKYAIDYVLGLSLGIVKVSLSLSQVLELDGKHGLVVDSTPYLVRWLPLQVEDMMLHGGRLVTAAKLPTDTEKDLLKVEDRQNSDFTLSELN